MAGHLVGQGTSIDADLSPSAPAPVSEHVATFSSDTATNVPRSSPRKIRCRSLSSSSGGSVECGKCVRCCTVSASRRGRPRLGATDYGDSPTSPRTAAAECGRRLPRACPTKFSTYLLRSTKLSRAEIAALYERFRDLAPRGNMTFPRFRAMLGMLGMLDDSFLPARLFCAFDTGEDGKLDFIEFATAIGTMVHENEDAKLNLAFRIISPACWDRQLNRNRCFDMTRSSSESSSFDVKSPPHLRCDVASKSADEGGLATVKRGTSCGCAPLHARCFPKTCDVPFFPAGATGNSIKQLTAERFPPPAQAAADAYSPSKVRPLSLYDFQTVVARLASTRRQLVGSTSDSVDEAFVADIFAKLSSLERGGLRFMTVNDFKRAVRTCPEFLALLGVDPGTQDRPTAPPPPPLSESGASQLNALRSHGCGMPLRGRSGPAAAGRPFDTFSGDLEELIRAGGRSENRLPALYEVASSKADSSRKSELRFDRNLHPESSTVKQRSASDQSGFPDDGSLSHRSVTSFRFNDSARLNNSTNGPQQTIETESCGPGGRLMGQNEAANSPAFIASVDHDDDHTGAIPPTAVCSAAATSLDSKTPATKRPRDNNFLPQPEVDNNEVCGMSLKRSASTPNAPGSLGRCVSASGFTSPEKISSLHQSVDSLSVVASLMRVREELVSLLTFLDKKVVARQQTPSLSQNCEILDGKNAAEGLLRVEKLPSPALSSLGEGSALTDAAGTRPRVPLLFSSVAHIDASSQPPLAPRGGVVGGGANPLEENGRTTTSNGRVTFNEFLLSASRDVPAYKTAKSLFTDYSSSIVSGDVIEEQPQRFSNGFLSHFTEEPRVGASMKPRLGERCATTVGITGACGTDLLAKPSAMLVSSTRTNARARCAVLRWANARPGRNTSLVSPPTAVETGAPCDGRPVCCGFVPMELTGDCFENDPNVKQETLLDFPSSCEPGSHIPAQSSSLHLLDTSSSTSAALSTSRALLNDLRTNGQRCEDPTDRRSLNQSQQLLIVRAQAILQLVDKELQSLCPGAAATAPTFPPAQERTSISGVIPTLAHRHGGESNEFIPADIANSKAQRAVCFNLDSGIKASCNADCGASSEKSAHRGNATSRDGAQDAADGNRLDDADVRLRRNGTYHAEQSNVKKELDHESAPSNDVFDRPPPNDRCHTSSHADSSHACDGNCGESFPGRQKQPPSVICKSRHANNGDGFTVAQAKDSLLYSRNGKVIVEHQRAGVRELDLTPTMVTVPNPEDILVSTLTRHSTFGPNAVRGSSGVLGRKMYMNKPNFDYQRKNRQTSIALRMQQRRRAEYQLLGPPRKGFSVHFGHRSWNMVLNMMVGLRLAAGRSNNEPRRRVEAYDFVMKEKISILPRSATTMDLGHTQGERLEAVRFIDYAPMVFRKLRELFDVSPEDYLRSVGPEQLVGNMVLGNLSSLSELCSEGRSGAFFYYTADGRFLLKTITRDAARFLRAMLRDYYEHIQTHPHSLLARFLGFHALRLKRFRSVGTRRGGGAKLFFVVMSNVFHAPVEIHRRYDLKGSLAGRSTPVNQRTDNTVALKDLDILELKESIFIGSQRKAELMQALKADAAFLQRNYVLDYSLLVGIHYIKGAARAISVEMEQTNLAGSVSDVRKVNEANTAGAAIATSINGGCNGDRFSHASSAQHMNEDYRSELGGAIASTGRVPRPFHQKNAGGLLSADGTVLYFMGIIDVLTRWRTAKKLEHEFKALTTRGGRTRVSCMPPAAYAKRFLQFLDGRLE